MATPDMDVIKEIPGYKVILKAILKSQIQQLVQQLASCTEEESVILTANVSDGTLCHLGSDSGKSFLEEKDDFKAQFLGFCLQRHNKKKQEEAREKERQEQAQLFSSQMSPRFSGPGQVYMPGMSPGISPSMHMPQRRSRPYPVSRPMRRPNPRPVLSNVMRPHTSTAPEPGIKMEPDDNDTNLSGSSQPTSPGSQSGSVDNTANNSAQLSLDSDLSGLMDSTQSDSNQTATVEQTPGPSSETGVKVENISESEFELEITGVELGSKPSGADSEGSGDSWRSPPGNMGGATGVSGDLQGSQSQQEYNVKIEAAPSEDATMPSVTKLSTQTTQNEAALFEDLINHPVTVLNQVALQLDLIESSIIEPSTHSTQNETTLFGDLINPSIAELSLQTSHNEASILDDLISNSITESSASMSDDEATVFEEMTKSAIIELDESSAKNNTAHKVDESSAKNNTAHKEDMQPPPSPPNPILVAREEENKARLYGRHFYMRIPKKKINRSQIRRCRVCSRIRPSVRRDTSIMCGLCPSKPALCLIPCFEIYHTVKEFWLITEESFFKDYVNPTTAEPNQSSTDAQNESDLSESMINAANSESNKSLPEKTKKRKRYKMYRSGYSVACDARLNGRHFIKRLPKNENQKTLLRQCRVCLSMTPRRRRETTFRCESCPLKPALCATPCFEVFHTVMEYWKETHDQLQPS